MLWRLRWKGLRWKHDDHDDRNTIEGLVLKSQLLFPDRISRDPMQLTLRRVHAEQDHTEAWSEGK